MSYRFLIAAINEILGPFADTIPRADYALIVKDAMQTYGVDRKRGLARLPQSRLLKGDQAFN